MIRGVRGATTVDANTREEILNMTSELLDALIEKNNIKTDDIISAFFTLTRDLDAEFPAVAARTKTGWTYVPLLCTQEIPVPGSLEKCIRVLLQINSEKQQDQICHVYLRGAKKLRPDLDH